MVEVSLLGGLLATAVAMLVAYYGSIAAFRLGLDPDNHGIPLLTSTLDLVGAISLILAVHVVGIA
jgi:mgtE-like transporter